MTKKFLKAGLISLAAVPLATGAVLTIQEAIGVRAKAYCTDNVTVSNTTVKVGKTYTTVLTPVTSGDVVVSVAVFYGPGHKTPVPSGGVKITWNAEQDPEDHGVTVVVDGKYITQYGISFDVTTKNGGSIKPSMVQEYPSYAILADEPLKVGYDGQATYTFQWLDDNRNPWKPEEGNEKFISVYHHPFNLLPARWGDYVELASDGIINVDANGKFQLTFNYVSNGGGGKKLSSNDIAKFTDGITFVCYDPKTNMTIYPRYEIPEQDENILKMEYSPASKKLNNAFSNNVLNKTLLDENINEKQTQGIEGPYVLSLPTDINPITAGTGLSILGPYFENGTISNIDWSNCTNLNLIGTNAFNFGMSTGSFNSTFAVPNFNQMKFEPKIFGDKDQGGQKVWNVKIGGNKSVYDATFARSNVEHITTVERNTITEYGIAIGSDFAIESTNLKSISLDGSVNYIGNAAFKGCTSLNVIDLTSLNAIPETWWSELHNDTFSGISSTGLILVNYNFKTDEVKAQLSEYFARNGLVVDGTNWKIICVDQNFVPVQPVVDKFNIN